MPQCCQTPQEAREGCTASRATPGISGHLVGLSTAFLPRNRASLQRVPTPPGWFCCWHTNSLGGVSGAAPWERGHGWTGAVASDPYPTAHILSRRWGLQCLWGPITLCGLGGQGWEEEAGRGDDGLSQSPAPPDLLTPQPPAWSDASIALLQKQPGGVGVSPAGLQDRLPA